MNDKELMANAIVKAIAYEENGGKPDINNPSAGQSGEMKSIFQFLPQTWADDSKNVFGKEVPLTPDNETYVMKQKVLNWIDQGKTVSEMASIHNSGNENAYKQNWKGTNKYGVAYDTPAYAANVLKYAKQFYNQDAQNHQPTISQPGPQQTLLNQQSGQSLPIDSNQQYQGLLGQATNASRLKI